MVQVVVQKRLQIRLVDVFPIGRTAHGPNLVEQQPDRPGPWLRQHDGGGASPNFSVPRALFVAVGIRTTGPLPKSPCRMLRERRTPT